MCDPVSITLVATAASGLMSAYGAYQQGQAQKKEAKYQADVAAQQAQLTQRTAEQNVNLTQEQGKYQAKQLARENIALQGEQKGMLAAQGIGGGSVTAADITGSTFDTQKLDELAIKYNTESKAWNIKNQAMYDVWNLGSQEQQYRTAAKNYGRAGTINAATSLLGTAGQIAQTKLKYTA